MPVLIFLLAIAVVLALSPMLIGIDVETRYQLLLDQAEQAGLVVADHDYQRGWFGSSSTALLELPVTVPESSNQVVEGKPKLVLHSDITHGPFSQNHGFSLAEIHSELKSGEPVTDKSSASINTTIRFDGTGESLITSSGMPLSRKTKRVSTEIKGLSVRITFDGDFREGSVALDISELSFHAVSGNRLKFSSANATSSYQIGHDGLSFDGGAIKVNQINLTGNSQASSAILEQPSLELSIKEESEHIDIVIEYLHQSLASNNSTYGPAKLRVGLENLSKKALEGIGQGIDQLFTKRQPNNSKESLLLATLLITSGVELLKYSPAVAIEQLHLETPNGVVEGNASLQLTGMNLSRTIHSSDILNRLTANGSLRIPEQSLLNIMEKATLREIKQQFEQRRSNGEEIEQPDEATLKALSIAGAKARLDHLLQQQLLVRNGKSITTRVKMKNGLLMANGIQVPLGTSAAELKQ